MYCPFLEGSISEAQYTQPPPPSLLPLLLFLVNVSQAVVVGLVLPHKTMHTRFKLFCLDMLCACKLYSTHLCCCVPRQNHDLPAASHK